MSDSSGFAVGGRGNAEPPDSDGSGFAVGRGDSPSPPPVKRLRGPARNPRAPVWQSAAAMCVFIVVDSSLRSSDQLMTKLARSTDALPHYEGNVLMVIAVAYISFKLRRPDEPVADDDMAELQRMDFAHVRRRAVEGFLDYTCDRIYMFNEPEHIFDESELSGDRTVLARTWSIEFNRRLCGSLKLMDICLQNDGVSPCGVLCVSNVHAELLAKELTVAVQCMTLSPRMAYRECDLVVNFPRRTTIKRFKLMSDDKKKGKINDKYINSYIRFTYNVQRRALPSPPTHRIKKNEHFFRKVYVGWLGVCVRYC